jgi:serine phosphatase RsbU (regulator of sigma subunit)
VTGSESRPAADRSRDGFSLEEGRRARRSPLHDLAWRRLRACLGLSLLAFAIHLVLGADSAAGRWLAAPPALAGWAIALRFLLLDSALPRFWSVWVLLAGILALLDIPGGGGVAVATGMSLILLLFRRYRPFRHLTSRRRAGAFCLGFVMLLILTAGWELVGDPDAGDLGGRLLRWSLRSLRMFWIFSLAGLFLGTRMSFLRLRPKLAVSGLYIALVPLFLATVFGIVATYGLLGSGHVRMGRAYLGEEERVLERHGILDPALFPERLDWSPGEAPPPADAPAWAPELAGALARGAARDTTAFLWTGPELWLARLEGGQGRTPHVVAGRVDTTLLDHVSRLLSADLGLYSSNDLVLTDEQARRMEERPDTTRVTLSLQGRRDRTAAAASDSLTSRPWWRRSLGFGATNLAVLRLADGALAPDEVLVHLQASLVDLARAYVGSGSELDRDILLGLAILAGLFLVIVALALFLGFRITASIISAVQDLHRATVRLAGGDLNARVDLPNEDELGDLAISFNAMTRAMRRGREEADVRQRLERELATARDIQQRLLPHDEPELAGFELTGASIPSREIGGDYFDFLALGERRLGIAIGDVSGKGMPAALLMSNLQACLQGQAIHPSTVAEVVGRVNDLLVRSTDPHMFATFVYGVLDADAGTLTLANAGHDPPVLVRAGGEVEEFAPGGLILGVMPRQEYRQHVVTLAPGDVLVLYTDGITEASGPPPPGVDFEDEDDDGVPDPVPEAMFGRERLVDVVRAHAGRPVIEIKEAILAAVTRHTAGHPQSDDITLVVVKRRRD